MNRPRLSSAAFAVILVLLSSSSPARAYSLTSFEWNESVTLKLADGRQLEGRFKGLLGKPTDPVDYDAHYEAWRSTMEPATVPALGETLIVTSRDGAVVRGAFRGLADDVMLLGAADSSLSRVVPLRGHVQIQRVGEKSLDSFPIRGHWKFAPSLYSMAIQVGHVTYAVPAIGITSQNITPHHGSDHGEGLAMGLVVGLVLGAVAAGAAMASAFSHALI
jgi:hypothetical protein